MKLGTLSKTNWIYKILNAYRQFSYFMFATRILRDFQRLFCRSAQARPATTCRAATNFHGRCIHQDTRRCEENSDGGRRYLCSASKCKDRYAHARSHDCGFRVKNDKEIIGYENKAEILLNGTSSYSIPLSAQCSKIRQSTWWIGQNMKSDGLWTI